MRSANLKKDNALLDVKAHQFVHTSKLHLKVWWKALWCHVSWAVEGNFQIQALITFALKTLWL